MDGCGQRRRRGVTAIALALWALGLALVVGCGSSRDPAPAPRPRVGLLISPQGLGDRGFNDLAHAALRQAEGRGQVELVLIEPAHLPDQEATLRFFAGQQLAAVIAMGESFAEGLRAVASSHPEVQFFLIDARVEGPNLHGIVFREEEGSFLCGALAALVAPGQPLGFVGGMDTPTIARFQRGFAAGARHVAPGAEVLTRYVASDASGFHQASAARELARGLYASGCAVIYHAAGGSGLGVIAAAVGCGRYAIGCDMEQDQLAPGRVLTSMLKRVDVVVQEVVAAIAAGRPPGEICRSWGLAEGGIALSGYTYSAEVVPALVQERIRILTADLLAGRIKID